MRVRSAPGPAYRPLSLAWRRRRARRKYEDATLGTFECRPRAGRTEIRVYDTLTITLTLTRTHQSRTHLAGARPDVISRTLVGAECLHLRGAAREREGGKGDGGRERGEGEGERKKREELKGKRV